jgi:hypothetical protein
LVSPFFVAGIYVLIYLACGLLCSLFSEETVATLRCVANWAVMFSSQPKAALAGLWNEFWKSWTGPILSSGILFGFAWSSMTGFWLSKLFFCLGNVILVMKLCVTEELHGKRDDRKPLGHRATVIVLVLVASMVISMIECGMVTNAERGSAPTMHNIWLASTWWRHESLPTPVQPTVYKLPLHTTTPPVKHHLSREITPCSMRTGTYYSDVQPLPGGPRLSRPVLLLEGSYENAWSWRDDKYLLLFEVAITNRGEESIVKDWELCLVVHGKPLKFKVGAVPSEGIALTTGDKISNETTITERAARNPIGHAQRMAGWVAFSVPADLAKELIPEKVGPTGAMSFKDYLDHTYSRDFVGNSEVLKAKVYVPGID